eukprot:762155-Hanusia_phi.AAC.1
MVREDAGNFSTSVLPAVVRRNGMTYPLPFPDHETKNNSAYPTPPSPPEHPCFSTVSSTSDQQLACTPPGDPASRLHTPTQP